MEHPSQIERIENCLARLQAGDESAREELINSTADRLVRLTRKMLRDHPRLHRWEDTDDVFQNGLLRLWTTLKATTPDSVQAYFRLAALVLRRELIDLARHYFGPEGLGHRYNSNPSGSQPADDPGNSSLDPQKLATWTELHEMTAALPDEERETFNLIWYHGLEQAEAAAVLGVSERTVQRRWQAVRLRLYEIFRGDLLK